MRHLLFAVPFLCGACSKPEEHAGHTTPPAASAPATKTATASASAAAPSGPPVLLKAAPMAGGLHLFWKVGSPCESLKLERKAGSGAYEAVATLPGEVDNKHDGGATRGAYTYRLTCLRSGGPLVSNELSATSP